MGASEVELLLLQPVLVLVLLSFSVWVLLYFRRLPAIASGKLDMRLQDPVTKKTPEIQLLAPANLNNLTEMPVVRHLGTDCIKTPFLLFYALVPILLQFDLVDRTFVRMAWAYVAFRAAHSFQHVRVGHSIPIRFGFYVTSCFILATMWARVYVLTQL